MKKVHARKWVEALRSGKYKQNSDKCLVSANGYCCLGVLNEIFPKLKLAGGNKEVLDNYRKIGLNSQNGHLECGDDFSPYYLSALNDGCPQLNGERLSFNEIADVIQIEYVEGL